MGASDFAAQITVPITHCTSPLGRLSVCLFARDSESRRPKPSFFFFFLFQRMSDVFVFCRFRVQE